MTTLVRDLADDLQLITDSQDVRTVAEWLGRDFEHGCMFVGTQDGDYTEIWWTDHTVPWNRAEATLLYKA